MAFSVRGARRLCASGGGLGRPATAAAARRGYFSDTLSLAPLNRVEATVATTPRVLMDARGRAVSPWHDVPLRVSAGGAGADGACYFVCEVPRGATARLHVSVATAGNPLVQGLGGDGKPRHLPFATLANHGVLPQTYTGPGAAGAAGAPLAVCEVGSQRAEPGAVYPVRLVGALPVTFPAAGAGGAVEWCLLAVRLGDPLADALAGAGGDLAAAPPAVARLLDSLRLWLCGVRVPAGGPPGAVAAGPGDGTGSGWRGRDEAAAVVTDAHAAWRRLVTEGKRASSKHLYGDGDALELALSARPWTPPARWAIPTDARGVLKAAVTTA